MRRVRAVLAFSVVVLRGLSRDRVALFFMLVLPVAVMVIVGTTFGGQDKTTLGLVRADAGPLAGAVEQALRAAPGLTVRGYDGPDALERAVRRQTLVAGVVLPAGFDAAVRSGRPGEVTFVGSVTSQAALTARVAVQGIVDRVGARFGAAQLATQRAGGAFGDNLALAERSAGPGVVGVRVDDVGRARTANLSRFSLTAPQNLVLFVFINAMASGSALVAARRNGILRRALATRSGMGSVLLGLGIGWFVLSLAQSLLILGVGALLFGVRWGDPLGAGLLVVVFALVGCGAGLLVGTLGENEDRVTSITPILGIVLGSAAAWCRWRSSRRRCARSRTRCRTTGRYAAGRGWSSTARVSAASPARSPCSAPSPWSSSAARSCCCAGSWSAADPQSASRDANAPRRRRPTPAGRRGGPTAGWPPLVDEEERWPQQRPSAYGTTSSRHPAGGVPATGGRGSSCCCPRSGGRASCSSRSVWGLSRRCRWRSAGWCSA
ncbi:MAG TPA: ABC transporter permease [Frankiaceae bacterium]|nr:ABC transporter permease [Frankiaceae bacterium]